MSLILTAYLDESGTHGGSAVTVMGGMIAKSSQWANFQRDFERAKKNYGFKVFHSKKFKRRDGDFAGWSQEKCSALYWDLAMITSRDDAFIEGVIVSLDNEAYDLHYKAGEKPKWLRLDSRYGLCFRECLLLFIREGLERRHRKKFPELHVVLESGHRNAGDAIRIFEEIKADLEGNGCDMLKSIKLAEKDECDPLMMSDFLAHSEWIMETKAREGVPRIRRPAASPKEHAITHLKYDAATLAKLKERLVAGREKPFSSARQQLEARR
jgi:Protein of unknown function (DUF3800)